MPDFYKIGHYSCQDSKFYYNVSSLDFQLKIVRINHIKYQKICPTPKKSMLLTN